MQIKLSTVLKIDLSYDLILALLINIISIINMQLAFLFLLTHNMYLWKVSAVRIHERKVNSLRYCTEADGMWCVLNWWYWRKPNKWNVANDCPVHCILHLPLLYCPVPSVCTVRYGRGIMWISLPIVQSYVDQFEFNSSQKTPSIVLFISFNSVDACLQLHWMYRIQRRN